MGAYVQYGYSILHHHKWGYAVWYCILYHVQEYAASVVLHHAQGYSVWYYMLYYHWGIQYGYVLVYCIIIWGGLHGMA